MAALTSQSIVLAGVTPSAVAVSASDTVAESQCGSIGVILRVINGGASPDTVTIVDPTLTDMGSAATNPTVSVPNAATRMILVPRFALNSSGQITIQHSFTTSVTIEVYRA